MAATQLKTWWHELTRRKVVRVAVAYPLVGWLLIQVADATFEPLTLPPWSITLVVVLVVLGYPLALILAWAFDITPQGIRRADGRAFSTEDSMGVLPFLDLSPERDQGYFCEGMAEEIINALAHLSGLRVASRTSSFKFANAPMDAREIGQQLGVRRILEGSVRKAGEKLRVTAQLIDVDSGFHLWSRRFDRNLADVFAIQDEIAAEVVSSLEIAPIPAEKQAISARLPPPALEAYDYYLRGRQFFYRFNASSLKFALEMFERAIDVSPTYAQAHAGIADTLSFRYMYVERRDETREAALEHAHRALELAPELAEAHASEGLALMLHRSYETAEASFRKALELNSDLYEAHYLYARALVEQGRLEEAAAEFTRASEVNPDDYQARLLLPTVYRGLGRERDARDSARRGIEAVKRHLKCHPDDVRAMYLMAGALAEMGEREEARDLTERALFFAPDTPDVLYNCACVFALLGDIERALDCLERTNLPAMANRDWITHDADLKALHGHPRYEALLERLQ